MNLVVTQGASLRCTMGNRLCTLNVTPRGILVEEKEAATITDHQPGAHISSFGMCLKKDPSSPCLPVLSDPWILEQDRVLIGSFPALTQGSKLYCRQGGEITIAPPNQSSVLIS